MFAQRLKELRSEKQISQTELAAILNISNRTISMYEQGNSEPTIETLSKMANYFNVTTDYLVGRSNGRFLSDQEIYERLGLDDNAVFCLEQLVKLSRVNDRNKKQLKNINALIGDIQTLMAISEYLNTTLKEGEYVVCKYYVSEKGQDLIEKPQNQEKLLNSVQWGNMFLADIQENLSRLKKELISV